MYHWIENIKNNVVRISTPYSTGNGLVIQNWNLIISHEHIVRDCRQVLVEGIHLPRQKYDILFLDEKYDIALIAFSHDATEDVKFETNDVEEDLWIVGLSITSELVVKKGKKILDASNGLTIKHNASLSSEFNGSPVFDTYGNLLGISIFTNTNNIGAGYYLPMFAIIKAHEDYRKHYPVKAIRCSNCESIVVDYSKHCHQCSNTIKSISHIEEYEARGINKLIEDVIVSLGYDVGISRRGVSKWLIDEGSADITITYNEKSGFIIAEATLAYAASEFETEMYTYLMKQNYFNKGMSFNLKDDSIILSLMIYDQHLHFNTCKKLIGNLIKSADRYDSILINEFGAKG